MENNNNNNTTVSHLRINTDEVYEFIEDKSILDILEFVKQSYPFTFIGRQKFRRKIDQLGFDFWIKDSEEKFVIVNNVFAKSQNSKISDIEGKWLSDIYDRNEYGLVRNITNYILFSSNSVIYEIFSKKNEPNLKQIVEFPICDIDDNVVAIIGFKQNAFQLDKLNNGNSPSIRLEEIPAVVVSVGQNFSVKNFSNMFYREFNLNPKSIINQSLQSIFNLDFGKLLLEKSGRNIKIGKKEYHFEYKNVSNNPEDGYFFSFIKLVEKSGKESSSEKTFDMVMHTSPDPMFIYGIDNLKFLKVNEAALKFYGYREDEFLGMDLTDLYAPEDIQTLVDSSSRNTVERGYTGPWRQKRKDGTTVEVEVSKSGIEYNKNRAHFNIIKDISSEADNNKIEEKYNLIFENSNDLIIETDADGFIQKINKSTINLLGYEKVFFSERPFLSLIIDDYRAKVNTSIFHSAKPTESNFNCELKTLNGKSVKVELYSTPLFGSNNEVESFLIIAKVEKEVVVKTVIEKVVEKEFITQAPSMDKKVSLEPEFLGHFFHELLTPVNVIVGFSQELAENVDSSDSDAVEASEIIKQNQKILLQLMDNAVHYTELEQGKLKLNPTNVHFVELIDSIEADVKKVSVNLDKVFAYGKISSSLIFETDENTLQILTSLLIEFAMRVTKNERVFLSAYQSGPGHCVVAVKDSRNEISKELAEGLKEIFSGDENTVRHKYGISRFMLRYALKLTKILADSAGVIRKYGDAFEFGFTFPMRFDEKKITEVLEEKKLSKTEKEIKAAQKIQDEIRANNTISATKVEETKVEETKVEETKVEEAKVEEAKVEELEIIKEVEVKSAPITVNANVNTQPSSQQNIQQPLEATEVLDQEVTEEVTPTLTETMEVEEVEPEIVEREEVKFENLSCLYVEDQIDSQILFKVQMKELKSIEFANSFEKAIPLLQSQVYDFIIMDINLQGEYNGLDALRAIQKMPEYKNVPIVAVTAYVLPGDRERFITAGFNDFISKPILRDKLESVLDNIF